MATSKDFDRTYASMMAGLQKNIPITRTSGSEIFFGIGPHNVSVRDGFNRQDYQFFRRDEAIPSRPKDILRVCMAAYHSVGIIRNVIDLMADFGAQGVNLSHPNERIEKFYKEWFKRISGPERSERFLNTLYRCANVIVKRDTAKTKAVEKEIERAAGDTEYVGGPDIDDPTPVRIGPKEIPWRYSILNPLTVELLNEELAPFLGVDNFVFGFKLPDQIFNKLRNPKNKHEKEVVSNLPKHIKEPLKRGEKFITLDKEKTSFFYYKRDDWQPWAFPMVHSILSDLNLLQKMKLADLCALDGAISNIRVWKLGDVKEKILPSEAEITRLAQMLSNGVGGGVMDLVWGPAIDLIETKTDVHHFLGDTKYGPVLTAIYAGLGIPPTMTGAGGTGGFTNNFISLKTLTERLEYGRSVLTAFWNNEIGLVQRAMGFRFPATLTFDRMVLTDEAAEKQLLINLADRGFISWESLIEHFGETADIEEIRLRRESRRREKGLLPPQAGPFLDAQPDLAIKKIFAQQGSLAPSELGIGLEEKKDGEKTPMEHKLETTPAKPVPGAKPKGQPGQGRPLNSNDKTKRKQKVVKTRTSAFMNDVAVAEEMQGKIAEIVTPFFLKSVSKANLRQLTTTEANNFETFKFSVLCNYKFGEPVTEKAIGKLIQKPLVIPDVAHKLFWETISEYTINRKHEPSLDDIRKFQAATYAVYAGENGLLEGESEVFEEDFDEAQTS